MKEDLELLAVFSCFSTNSCRNVWVYLFIFYSGGSTVEDVTFDLEVTWFLVRRWTVESFKDLGTVSDKTTMV